MKANTIFTNVALTDDGDVWWEGIDAPMPEHLIDWQGNDFTPADAAEGKKAAHPNSRFTTPASQCPIICPDWEAPEGVAIDAILFGGRRATNVPLVAEQYENAHGVFIGSAVASEVTAAALDAKVGSLRHDPMAMLPFCGYHMADYWSHWLEMQEKLGDKFPKVYQVNWFRKDENGKFIWPGYGDNSRVLDWIVRRASGEVEAVDGVTGRYPKFEDFNLEGSTWARRSGPRCTTSTPRPGPPRWTTPRSTTSSSVTSSPSHQGAARQVPCAHRRGQEGLIAAEVLPREGL